MMQSDTLTISVLCPGFKFMALSNVFGNKIIVGLLISHLKILNSFYLDYLMFCWRGFNVSWWAEEGEGGGGQRAA